MRTASKKNKPREKQWSVSGSPVIPDWEAAHIFLEVARCGGFRAASQKLGQSVNARGARSINSSAIWGSPC